jgi:hypothetical protein
MTSVWLVLRRVRRNCRARPVEESLALTRMAHGLFEDRIGFVDRGRLAVGVKGREVSFQARDDLRPSFRAGDKRLVSSHDDGLLVRNPATEQGFDCRSLLR